MPGGLNEQSRRTSILLLSILLRMGLTSTLLRRSSCFSFSPVSFVSLEKRRNILSQRIGSFGVCNGRLLAHSCGVSFEHDGDEDNHYQRRASKPFKVTAPHDPSGDQPEAIDTLIKHIEEGDKFSVLRGITGTGKTLVMSHVIAKSGRPTLVLCHNKVLAAQLARELRSFLGENAVELFISYYNVFRPECYIETSGKYLAKRSSINQEINAMRHRATKSLLERDDVVIVASTSAIFGLGLPEEYLKASISFEVGDQIDVHDLKNHLERLIYDRVDTSHDLQRGSYSITTAHIDQTKHFVSFWPPMEKSPIVIEIQYQGQISKITAIQTMASEHGAATHHQMVRIYPSRHHVTSGDYIVEGCQRIEEELGKRVQELQSNGKHAEAERLQRRVTNDLLSLRETGYCPGVENYSRHLEGRKEGEPPSTLVDYMDFSSEKDWLLMVDESHVTLPQIKAMYKSDRARKESLVKHGFRLPSAFDNRPLQDREFWKHVRQAVFVSATPSQQELNLSWRQPIEMTIRPTFVCDPEIEVRPLNRQLRDLLNEVRSRVETDERTLVVSLTKRDAEVLSEFLNDNGVKAAYIHSDLKTQERSEALKDLQTGKIDCLVGVNLLREGLDLPQVSLVAILNADSQGFLRSKTSLLQTVGRAARNRNGKAIFYADRVTESMEECMKETSLRRQKQMEYNKRLNLEPITVKGSNPLSVFDLLRQDIANGDFIMEPSQNGVSDQEEEAIESTSILFQPQLPFYSLPMANKEGIKLVNIPAKPGVYFWKDKSGETLYIGKSNNLRRRIKSYLSPKAKHTRRIATMLSKASSVEFIITPSDRDALVLENNHIKHHQPPYNVLLKDDVTYPYICATVGDAYPRLHATPLREMGDKGSKYRYFGPYPHADEINVILQYIESKYKLRRKSLLARSNDGLTRAEYNEIFNNALQEVFGNKDNEVSAMRKEYEEGSMLFESEYNTCRDVVSIVADESEAVVLVVQLRDGLVAGRFSYWCTLRNAESKNDERELGAITEQVLRQQHYPSGGESSDGTMSFFPDEILLQYPHNSTSELVSTVEMIRQEAEPHRKRGSKVSIRTVASRGKRKGTDEKAMNFTAENAMQLARIRQYDKTICTSIDSTAANQLASLLSLETPPSRIECFDISHTGGEDAVGSRVVFINGQPAPKLYRRFNIKTVKGIDDYACISEILERRFKNAWDYGKLVDKNNPWAMPDLVLIDGGKGQLSAALQGMKKAKVYPRPANNDTEPRPRRPRAKSPKQPKATVTVCALAKEKEELFVHDSSLPVNGSPDSAALLLLRSLRDESHRFALSNHRKRRSVKTAIKNEFKLRK